MIFCPQAAADFEDSGSYYCSADSGRSVSQAANLIVLGKIFISHKTRSKAEFNISFLNGIVRWLITEVYFATYPPVQLYKKCYIGKKGLNVFCTREFCNDIIYQVKI